MTDWVINDDNIYIFVRFLIIKFLLKSVAGVVATRLTRAGCICTGPLLNSSYHTAYHKIM